MPRITVRSASTINKHISPVSRCWTADQFDLMLEVGGEDKPHHAVDPGCQGQCFGAVNSLNAGAALKSWLLQSQRNTPLPPASCHLLFSLPSKE